MSEVNTIPIGADDDRARVSSSGCGTRASRCTRGDDKCPLPADLAPDELTVERAGADRQAVRPGRASSAPIPTTGETVLVLTGRFGPFVQLGELEEGTKAKPKRASLFESMDPETVDLENALQAARRCRASSAPTPRATRSPRRTAATART